MHEDDTPVHSLNSSFIFIFIFVVLALSSSHVKG